MYCPFRQFIHRIILITECGIKHNSLPEHCPHFFRPYSLHRMKLALIPCRADFVFASVTVCVKVKPSTLHVATMLSLFFTKVTPLLSLPRNRIFFRKYSPLPHHLFLHEKRYMIYHNFHRETKDIYYHLLCSAYLPQRYLSENRRFRRNNDFQITVVQFFVIRLIQIFGKRADRHYTENHRCSG